MIHIKDQHIEIINSDSAQKYTNQNFTLDRCVINTLDLNALEFHGKVNILNCIIHQLIIYGSWFSGGLNFSNNIIYSSIDYQKGGHNQKEIEISGNILNRSFSFLDCQFDGKLSVKNNIFCRDLA
ncbi:MAG TPA: hypothetical protein PLF38_01490 [Xylanibacter oryzae]|nr:hypothetical protein [Xylanibacter oryzae]